jgi:hypothetical protein
VRRKGARFLGAAFLAFLDFAGTGIPRMFR